MTLRTLIIDDDPFVCKELRQFLLAHVQIQVVGEAQTLVMARHLIAETRPDVVLLDVQLRGGSGFDLISDLPVTTAVIFITAFDAFAVRAFEVNALDYLMKPVNEARLAEAISRMGSRRSLSRTGVASNDQLLICCDSGQRFVAVDDVVAITSLGGNYSTLELRDGSRPVVRRTLREWEEVLRLTHCRVHRNTIVSLNSVERLEKTDQDALVVYLRGLEEPVLVSRRRAAMLRDLVGSRAR